MNKKTYTSFIPAILIAFFSNNALFADTDTFDENKPHEIKYTATQLINLDANSFKKLKEIICYDGKKSNVLSIYFNTNNVQFYALQKKIPKTVGHLVFTGKNLKQIPDHALNNFDCLETLVIEADVKEIGDFFANNCTRLKSVILPKTLKKLESTAFNECNSLKTITLPPPLLSSICYKEDHTFRPDNSKRKWYAFFQAPPEPELETYVRIKNKFIKPDIIGITVFLTFILLFKAHQLYC